MHQQVYVIPATDTINGVPPNPIEHAHILAFDPCPQGNLPNSLEIFIGVPCMITENAYTPLGVANGSHGIVLGVCFDLHKPPVDPKIVSIYPSWPLALYHPSWLKQGDCHVVLHSLVCPFQTQSTQQYSVATPGPRHHPHCALEDTQTI